MTQPTSPDSAKSSQKLKTLVAQGLVGAVSLAGATAIPIIIKQFLEPPATPTPAAVSSPTPSIPASPIPVVSPAAATPIPASASITTMETPALQEANAPNEASSAEDDKHENKNRGRNKNK